MPSVLPYHTKHLPQPLQALVSKLATCPMWHTAIVMGCLIRQLLISMVQLPFRAAVPPYATWPIIAALVGKLAIHLARHTNTKVGCLASS